MKAIKGFPGYGICEDGTVLSNKGNGIGQKQAPWKKLKPYNTGKGYEQVRLHKGTSAIIQNKYVHRLVAEAFLPNKNSLPEVDHINNIRNDNTVKNLQWISKEENKTKSSLQIEVFVMNKENGTIHRFKSITKASSFLGISGGRIYASLRKNNIWGNYCPRHKYVVWKEKAML